MGTRLELHSDLKEILGTSNVYFQPPATLQMKYPCIVYQRSPDNIRFADNEVYTTKRRYSITIIDRNADTELPDKVLEIGQGRLDRIFTSDNLNHYIIDLYY